MTLRPTRRVLAAAALATPSLAAAETWPSRPLTILLPVAPGGPGEMLGRLLGHALTQALGQPVVLDHRPGAGGTIGMDAAARSRPDGHTLVIVSNSTYAIAPHLYPMPYDTAAAFAPIALIAQAPSFLSVHRDVPARDLAEFIALLRRRPGELAYSTAGIGFTSHLATELFLAMTNTAMLHVPYRGGAPAAQALLSGEVQANCMEAALVRSLLPTGLLRPLAVTSRARHPALPEVPALHEAGVPGFESATWWAMLAPSGVPQPILDRLAGIVLAAMATEEVRGRIAGAGFLPVGTGAAAFRAHIAEDSAKWGEVIRTRGIRLA